MGIRVVARIRPQQKNELEKDVIVSTANHGGASVVKVPNPKNENELYSFQFSGIYDQHATQQDIFDNEIAPTIKHLFNGYDVTVFAYGSTGTGKTHTMRGAKSLADRGVIPRLLSGVYRRARKIIKDSEGATNVSIALSYYEIYNDKVFDLFESPEKRSATGLPLRDNGGKTVVVGLTERPCESLKEFEQLYDEANVNRSTGATKLNACSSRSHAILRLTLSITTGDRVRTCIASAIDLAGSEDNRRTENGKERMVESASINKSLFTLAKCVEAISRGDERIPYRESKMTRILSLGQTKGITVMILNLAPVRSYHLDTLSSLNFANRTKKIEVREIENEPVFKGCTRPVPSVTGTTLQRQPLRPLSNTVHNASISAAGSMAKKHDKNSKAFAVYSDLSRPSITQPRARAGAQTQKSSPLKRPSDPFISSASRPAKRRTPFSKPVSSHPNISKQAIEDMIERKVTDILAARALDQPSIAPQPEISEEVQRRLDDLEKKIKGKDDGREQGLTFLLMAKQHAVRGEDTSALRMYTLAQDFFPNNEKLESKIERLQAKLRQKKCGDEPSHGGAAANAIHPSTIVSSKLDRRKPDDSDYEPDEGRNPTARKMPCPTINWDGSEAQTPRTRRLLVIVNSGDKALIRQLRGVGAKKAEAMLECFAAQDGSGQMVRNLKELSRLRGVGVKAVESMREGLS